MKIPGEKKLESFFYTSLGWRLKMGHEMPKNLSLLFSALP